MASALDISIIIPTRNVQDYIFDCLSSCCGAATDGPPMSAEIIIVHDDSSDLTGLEIERFRAQHPDQNIRVLETDGVDLAEVRNHGFKHAAGDYVAFVDGDDLISRRSLNQIVSKMQWTRAEMACSRSIAFDDTTLHTWELEEAHLAVPYSAVLGTGNEFYLTSVDDTPELLALQTSMCTRIFSRKFLERYEISHPNRKFCEDVEPSRKAFLSAKSVLLTNCYYYYYRQNRPGQKTYTRSGSNNDLLGVIAETIALGRQLVTHPEQGKWIFDCLVNMTFWTLDLLPESERNAFVAQAANLLKGAPESWLWPLTHTTHVTAETRTVALSVALKSETSCIIRALQKQGLPAMKSSTARYWRETFRRYDTLPRDDATIKTQPTPAIATGIARRFFVSDDVATDKLLATGLCNDLCSFEGLDRLQDLHEAKSFCVVLSDRNEVSRAIHHLNETRSTSHLFYYICRDLVEGMELLPSISSVSKYIVLLDRALQPLHTSRTLPYDVSIIIPFYNTHEFLRRCALSLLDQDFHGRLQIIFIDDGSTDDSARIIEELRASDDRIVLLRKLNGGAASARNAGLELARGAYIGFVDSDDYVTSDFVQSMYSVGALSGCDIVQSEFSELTGNDYQPHVETCTAVRGRAGPMAAPAFSIMPMAPAVWRRLYKASFLRANRLQFNESFKTCEDLEFHILASSLAQSVSLVRSSNYRYTIGRAGQDYATDDHRLFVNFRIFANLNKSLYHRFQDAKFLRIYLETMFAHHNYAYNNIRLPLKETYLRGMAQQIFGEFYPIPLNERVNVLKALFPRQHEVISKCVQIVRRQKTSVKLPSDLEAVV